EKKEKYEIKDLGSEKYPRHKIPLALMFRDLFTLRCGLPGKLRALYLAFIRPKRLVYRYWPWHGPTEGERRRELNDVGWPEKLATSTRILAMQGLLGLFGHISVYQPENKRVFMSPGAGSDKATVQGKDILVADLDGRVLEGKISLPIEWPIHTTLHGARADA